MNIGLDFRLFDHVSTTIEVYERKSSDLLLELPLSMVTGFSDIWTNIGRLRNRGIEVPNSSAETKGLSGIGEWYETMKSISRWRFRY